MVSLTVQVLSHKTEINDLYLSIRNSEVVGLNVFVKHFPNLMQSLNGIENLE